MNGTVIAKSSLFARRRAHHEATRRNHHHLRTLRTVAEHIACLMDSHRLTDGGIRVHLRHRRRCLPLRSLDRDIGPCPHQEPDDLRMPVRRGHEQRRRAIRRLHIDVRPGVQQQRYQQRVPLVHRVHQRRPAPPVARVHVRTGRERRLHAFDVARLRGPMKGVRPEPRRTGSARLRGHPRGIGGLRAAAGLRAAPALRNRPHGTQPLHRQHLRRRQAGITQERPVSLSRAPAPDAVSRTGPVSERAQQALRLANRPRWGRTRIRGVGLVRCRNGHWGLGHRCGRGIAGSVRSGSPRHCPFLRRRYLHRRHLRRQRVPLLQRRRLTPARRQVEPLVRLDIVLEHAQALNIQPPERQHRLPVARVRRRAPLSQRLVRAPGVPRALPRRVVGPCRLRYVERQHEDRYPDCCPTHASSLRDRVPSIPSYPMLGPIQLSWPARKCDDESGARTTTQAPREEMNACSVNPNCWAERMHQASAQRRAPGALRMRRWRFRR